MLWWNLVYGILDRTGPTVGAGLFHREKQFLASPIRTIYQTFQLPPVHLPVNFRSLASGADFMGKFKGKLHADPGLKRLNVPPLTTTDPEDHYTD